MCYQKQERKFLVMEELLFPYRQIPHVLPDYYYYHHYHYKPFHPYDTRGSTR